MLIRFVRWFCIGAPLLAGVALIIFGTSGGISVAFGVTLIGISLIVWMWNWFVRMSFAETTREKEAVARERGVGPAGLPLAAPRPITPRPPGARGSAAGSGSPLAPIPPGTPDPHSAPHRGPSGPSAPGHARRRPPGRPRRPS